MKDLILIVDDTPENLQVLGQNLRQAEYDVAMAMSGQEAIDFLLKGEEPQLILLDINMPELNGFDTCKKIKGFEHFKDIPVIFLTARTETEDIVKGFETGGVDYITKPFEPAELLARISTHISLKKAREEVMLLQGMLPICSHCHKARNEEGLWKSVEEYLREKKVAVSHSLCGNCLRELYPGMADDILKESSES